MLVCGECGAANEEGEDFCGECGAYLDWDAERVATGPTAEPATGPTGDAGTKARAGTGAGTASDTRAGAGPGRASQQPGGLVDRMREAMGIGGGTARTLDAPTTTTVAEPTVPEPTAAEQGDGPERLQPVEGPAEGPVLTTPSTETVAGAAADASALGVAQPVAPVAPMPVEDEPPAEEASRAETKQAGSEPGRERAGPAQIAPDTAAALVVKVAPTGTKAAGPTRPTAGATEAPTAREPSEDQPGAVRPGAPAPRPRRPVAPKREPIDHGDLICGDCGAGNKPTRKFCRRCGHDLVDAVVASVPWWKRILQRRRKTQLAGSRPQAPKRRRHRPTKYLVLLVALGLLGSLGWSYRSVGNSVYEAVLDRVVGSEPFHPEMSASGSTRGASAGRAADGIASTFWSPGGIGKARGQVLRARFDDPFRLLHVIVTPGVSTKQPEFLRRGRPAVLRLVATSTEGEVVRERLELKDQAGAQVFDVTISDVERVNLRILAATRGSVRGSRVAIAEVEFRGRD